MAMPLDVQASYGMHLTTANLPQNRHEHSLHQPPLASSMYQMNPVMLLMFPWWEPAPSSTWGTISNGVSAFRASMPEEVLYGKPVVSCANSAQKTPTSANVPSSLALVPLSWAFGNIQEPASSESLTPENHLGNNCELGARITKPNYWTRLLMDYRLLRTSVGYSLYVYHQRADFWNEACKLADLHHPNVVAFYGVVLDGPGGSVATVTEYMVNGSLRNALQKNDKYGFSSNP
ncbi:hypothetical protein QJS10_CPA02g01210 [Acorus calamus]|uniref:Serine-threonine/tyrosine-protein kinase catalytic domain-containing protein n=1 Tax=Acorus calamus TaxID=4465 RepID=A0AAV9FIE6_ACOCL|nr:hypothetical protein QJS10_CPA02g01210 [Acorus calamus]